MIIKVPATTANLGPGFDSFGLALSLYLELEILEKTTIWKISHDLENIPHDEKNLIIQVAKKVFPDISAHHIKMTTTIPTARGLGSSSSAIVAGIELANQLGNLGLTNQEKVKIATEIEGHPDNVAPAILGKFVVSTMVKDVVFYNQHDFPACGLITVIPKYELLTSESRGVLPEVLSYSEGVMASSIANMALSFLVANKLEQASELMTKDLWHEPYRKKLIKEFELVSSLKSQLGFYGALISGAGPTILVLAPTEKTVTIHKELKQRFKECDVKILKTDLTGVQVIK